MKKAIIIFVRNPQLGKVKTRLAREIGDVRALRIYHKLLQHTHAVTAGLDCDKFVYYADRIGENDQWDQGGFEKRIQEGEQLGDRMLQAFFNLFQQGYTSVLIIGSDCPGLTGFIIEDAFDQLRSGDVVIGPATDGGYYLLGMTRLFPVFFKEKQWSTSTVLADTIRDTVQLKLACSFLTELSDIDTADDLRRYQELLNV